MQRQLSHSEQKNKQCGAIKPLLYSTSGVCLGRGYFFWLAIVFGKPV